MAKFVFNLFVLLVFVSCDKGDNDINNVTKREFFAISVSTSPIGGNEASELESDLGVLLLPEDYFNTKRSIRVVIYCHSGGGYVTSTDSEAENMDFVKYFVSKGYAVLSMMGMPVEYSERLDIDPGRYVGSHVSLRSIIAGYKYIINKYRIAKDGCFVFSNSNGGLLAGNIVNLTTIPVLAQSGVAPLLSTELNGWNVSTRSTRKHGFKAYQNRANIIRLFGMKNITTYEELVSASYEKNKVGVYDPYDYCMNQTKLKYKSPYLIFSGKSETVIIYDLAEKFRDEMNLRGAKIILDTDEEYGNHSIAPSPLIVGNFQYENSGYPLKLTVKKTGDFFDFYNPDLHGK